MRLLTRLYGIGAAVGNMNKETFAEFVQDSFLQIIMPYNGTNLGSFMILENAGMHYVEEIVELIVTRAGAKLCFLPPYSGMFSHILRPFVPFQVIKSFGAYTVYAEIFTRRKSSPILPPALIGKNFIMLIYCPVLKIAKKVQQPLPYW